MNYDLSMNSPYSHANIIKSEKMTSNEHINPLERDNISSPPLNYIQSPQRGSVSMANLKQSSEY